MLLVRYDTIVPFEWHFQAATSSAPAPATFYEQILLVYARCVYV